MEGDLDELALRAADGRLVPSEREAALRRLAAAGRGPEVIAVQRRACELLRLTGDVSAPAGLRLHIAELARAPARPPRRRLVLRRPRIALAAAVATALAAALVVALTALGPSARPPRQLALAVAVASIRPIAATAPATAGDGALLDRSFAGVTFPDWSGKLGWRAVGTRADVIAGRRAETIFYLHHGHRIGYTVLAGPAPRFPAGGRRVRTPSGSVRLFAPAPGQVDVPRRLLRHGGRFRIAVFVRHGRLCVLAGVVHHARTLTTLASWRGGGAVTF